MFGNKDGFSDVYVVIIAMTITITTMIRHNDTQPIFTRSPGINNTYQAVYIRIKNTKHALYLEILEENPNYVLQHQVDQNAETEHRTEGSPFKHVACFFQDKGVIKLTIYAEVNILR